MTPALLVLLLAAAPVPMAAPSTRDLARINWMELREWVPSRVETVLLPLGTLEAHGVTANGADILAPVAIAEVLGEDGGHAGENENAFMLAIDPALVHKERYSPDLATANPAPNTWIAYPNPSSIGLYKEGQGYPRFDAAKAKVYFAKVNDKVAALVQDTIRKWDAAGLFR